jgi:phosphatidylethanolamine/phosphatidyl-N-methylethanolamine N-methyltransferase
MGTTKLSEAVVNALGFLKQFAGNPTEVGAVLPSSAWLANAMMRGLDFQTMKLVVEYGPGTGAFTKKLRRRLPPSVRYVAFETNAAFQQHLKVLYPDMDVVLDYAENIGSHLGEARGQVDLVISGLPFSMMPWTIVEKTLRETYDNLRPGGHFRTFVYYHTMPLPKIRRMMRMLEREYSQVTIDSSLRNIPPAKVIRCIK